MRGKLIVVEGTDCSGKETQTKLLVNKLNESGNKSIRLSFPMYDTPTGKIIGGPYLGKTSICSSWFQEGAVNVDSKVASLYYAADRLYNINKIEELLNNGMNVVLDRYLYSNMAHQGGKISIKEDRIKMYDFIEELEINLLKLPLPDIKVFLHMPYEETLILKEHREEEADGHEKSVEHLKNAESSFLEISNRYNFKNIECSNNHDIRTIEDINNELYNYVINKI